MVTIRPHWLHLVFLAAGATAVSAKTERTFYTPAKLARMQANLEQHAWAREERDAILQRAARYADWSDDRLRALVPPPCVPRAYVVHESGCPVHGTAVNKIGRYSWRISPEEPWKVRCPVGGEAYPSNDFGAYLAGGMQDRSMLGGDHADDGWGWIREGEPKKYWFVGFYAHWLARNILLPALTDLSLAHLLTDDPRHARACGVLLRQLADYYPDYQYEKQSRYGTEFRPDYLGRLLYHTWECFTVQTVAPAYDAIRATLSAEARDAIEERLLRRMALDIMDGSHRIQGNYGMHQKGLIWIAAVLSHATQSPTSQEMIAWVLHNDAVTQYTDLGFHSALDNLVHRDGYPFESPGYNVAWNRDLGQVAEALLDAGVSVFEVPRFRKLQHWPLAMACAGEFTPSLGDSNNMFGLVTGWTAEIGGLAFRHYRTPAWAKALQQVNARPSRDLFSEPLDEAMQAAAAAHPDPVGTTSQRLPGVGFASLQAGSDANRTAVSVFYGYYVGHRHFDRLHIDLFSHRNSLLPDFGYPETADSFDPRRSGFFEHTVTHNTVMMDAAKQAHSRGRLHVYDPGPWVQTIEVSAEDAYPGKAGLYRRTLILVEVEPDQAFVVDVFRVRGGRQHDYLLHGTEARFATDLPLSPPRREGTLAGRDVPYGQFYDDPVRRDKPAGTVAYSGYTGSGFQFLFNVQETALRQPATVNWHLNRSPELFPKRPTEGVTLRAHLVGSEEQVLVAEGRPQNRATWPETVTWLIRRRTGEDLESLFVTVFEPYKDKPFIEAVTPHPTTGEGMPVALTVRAAGHAFLVCSRLCDGSVSTLQAGSGEEAVATDGAVTVLARDAAGALAKAYLLGGSEATWGNARVTGNQSMIATVAAVDYQAGEVTLDRSLPDHAPCGDAAIVTNQWLGADIPMVRRLAPARFSVGDDDLRAGRFAVQEVVGDTIRVTPPMAFFVQPGMTVVNERGEAVARLLEVRGNRFVLSDPVPGIEAFPDADGDGRRSVAVTMVGPGDRVTLHHSVRQ